ncbi:MAG: HNH endonuclease [Gemmatimonadales bacterium]|nr:HNH endonuclease [Gemmatimonadales bacterium]
MYDDVDTRVRAAAFSFLETEVRRAGSDVLPRTLLAQGFILDDRRVPLVGPSGIFKPAVLPEMPLSITTVPVEDGQAPPYRDVIGRDGLLRYCYRGTDPYHRDNIGLRLARQRQVPLLYCHGVVTGLYAVVWPVFIVDDSPRELMFTVSVDDRQLASVGAVDIEDPATEGRRRYITRQVQQRLHQESFRQRVLAAYRAHCAVCRLRHAELLEAAHILPDGHPHGEPIVPNGVALCKLHHAAFDSNILGITPDYGIEIRLDILEERDGPMLTHGLQGFHHRRIQTPVREGLRPRREFLEERYDLFRRATP